MSYILEALKKSEQERGTGSTPNVQTVHSSSLQYTQQKKPLWPLLLIAVLLVNIVVMALFLIPKTGDTVAQITATDSTTSTTVSQPHTVTPAYTPSNQQPVALNQNATEPAQSTTPGITPTIHAERQTQAFAEHNSIIRPTATTVTQPQHTTATHLEHNDLIDIVDLPVDIQTSIPDMTFSAHVYSSNPIQRSVVINGNFMEENDMLTASLKLDEITPDGVIFDYRGTRFRSSVLGDWKNEQANN